jgi:hypothetical protein
MRVRRFLSPLAFMTIFLPSLASYLGCGKDSSPTSPSDIVFPSTNVSYSQHVQPLFNTSCALAGCHDDVTRQNNLSLTSYQNATARAGIIVAGNADGSILAQRIDGRLQPQMPFNRPPLNSNQINGIKTWINEGARNN